jgi:hypothetical protein
VLAVRVSGRLRASGDLWQADISERFKASEYRAALWSAACDPTQSNLLRHVVFRYLLLDAPERAHEILGRGLADPSPDIGLWAFAELQARPRCDEHAELLKIALATKHAGVRLRALRQCARGADDCEQTLRAALFDPARSVRAYAAFELGRAHGVSALPLWREAARHTQSRVSVVALTALCEAGEPADVETVASEAVARDRGLRCCILRGLSRVGSSLLEAQLRSALKDRSARVARQAAEIYERGIVPLDSLTLEDALSSARDDVVPSLMSLSVSLSKWDGLEFLLRHALSQNAQRALCAAHQIERWISRSSHRFTAPSTEQMHRLTRLLENGHGHWRLRDFGLDIFTQSDIQSSNT